MIEHDEGPGGRDEAGERPGQIVVGVDGSAGADQALEWAVGEAQRLGAVLEVCSFWTFPTVGYPAAFDYHDFADVAREALDKALGRVAELDPSLEVTGLTSEEPPAVGLVRASKGARLLVVGSRGLGGFRSLLLGSVGRYCVEHAHCPVLVVRTADDEG